MGWVGLKKSFPIKIKNKKHGLKVVEIVYPQPTDSDSDPVCVCVRAWCNGLGVVMGRCGRWV